MSFSSTCLHFHPPTARTHRGWLLVGAISALPFPLSSPPSCLVSASGACFIHSLLPFPNRSFSTPAPEVDAHSRISWAFAGCPSCRIRVVRETPEHLLHGSAASLPLSEAGMWDDLCHQLVGDFDSARMFSAAHLTPRLIPQVKASGLASPPCGTRRGSMSGSCEA